MNKLTVFSWFGFPIPMEERFKLIKAAGFDGVLLWWSDEHADVFRPDRPGSGRGIAGNRQG